jgi:VanZ family protein
MFSQDSAVSSTEKSDKVASTIVNLISNITHSDNIEYYIDNIIVIVRKTAHFLEYLVLGVLLINVLKDYRELTFGVCLFAILFCLGYAITDEVHQLFVSERSGRILDVLIDTLGSLSGILIYWLIKHKTLNEKYLVRDAS